MAGWCSLLAPGLDGSLGQPDATSPFYFHRRPGRDKVVQLLFQVLCESPCMLAVIQLQTHMLPSAGSKSMLAWYGMLCDCKHGLFLRQLAFKNAHAAHASLL